MEAQPTNGENPAFKPHVDADNSLQLDNNTLPEAQARALLDSLRGTLQGLRDEDRIVAVAHAINMQAQERFDAERERYLKSFERVQDLHATIMRFAETLQANRIGPGSFPALGLTFSADKANERASQGFLYNPITGTFDQLFTSFVRQISRILACQEGTAVYKKRGAPLCAEVSRSLPLDEKAKIFDKLKENQTGFLELVESLEESMKRFPLFARKILDSLQSTHRRLLANYGPETPEKDEDSGPALSIFDIFDRSRGPRNLGIPLYKENIYLTGFLHDIAERIPTSVKEPEEKRSKRLAKDPEVAEFVTYLKAHCDPQVYSAINSVKVYEGVSRCLKELGECLQSLYVALKATSLSDYRKSDRSNAQAVYQSLAAEVESQITGEVTGAEAFQSFRDFRLAEIMQTINAIESTPIDANREKEGKPVRPLSRREKKYQQLFERLDEFVGQIIRGEAGNPEIEKFLTDIMPLKQEVEGNRAVKNESLSNDINRGNYAFDVIQGNHGDLEFKRIPTSTASYDDVVGVSWEIVRDKLDTLRDYSQFPHFYHDMTARGTINNNMLIVGPYGCGKNLFLKALMADPKIIGVNVTTDRIISMWHGASERNTRTLFELAREKRFQLDRPTVLGWDEFDSLFPRKGKGGFSSTSEITSRMQKILQSVLCGDTVYEGVALIGLTNEPEQIPMAVWRRFAHVVVIQPLSDKERRSTMMHMVSGLPLTPEFEQRADWEHFYKLTEEASGDVIGKIFDRMYRQVRDQILEDHGTLGMQSINDQAKALKAEHGKLTQEMRAELFTRATGGKFLVSPDDMMRAVTAVVKEPDVIQAMRRQARFYHEVDKRFDDAAMNDD